MSRPRVPTSRRTAIALALSAPLALAACDIDPPSAVPTATPTAEPLPDAEVVASARKTILLAVAQVEAVDARHPTLRAANAPLLAMHAAHLAVLGDSEDQAVEAPYVDITLRGARIQVATAENAVADALVGAAGQAASGDLARALASMAAAITQRVAT